MMPLRLHREHPELDRGAIDLEEFRLLLLAPPGEGENVAAVLGGGGGPVVEQEPAEDAELRRRLGVGGRRGGPLLDLGDGIREGGQREGDRGHRRGPGRRSALPIGGPWVFGEGHRGGC